jgi:flagellar hook assembly protein FlgD
VSKIKKSLSVLCYKKKNTKLPSGFRWMPFLIFQLFVTLLVFQPNAWAGLLSLSVDANGDNVFNGEEEKLQITFETGDDGAAGQTYEYKIFANGQEIFKGPEGDSELSNNQTVRVEWDGAIGSGDQRKKLPDGEYTIKVELTQPGGFPVPAPERGELEVNATLDTTAPKITIGIGDNAFSPVVNSIPVYYSLSENATRARLEFQRAPGDATIGRPIEVSSESGNHTYNWDGKDSTANRFADGQYTLKLWVKDRGGNEATTAKTETITIDSTEPRITGLFLSDTISLVDGMFVNASIPTISFTADDGDGTGIDLTGSETEILIKRVDGANINGTLTYGNRATFSLSNSLDELTENGNYEVTVSIADKVGNVTSRQAKFTFDNAAPTLKSVATNKGEFVPGSGLKGLTNFVEAALEDNIELNLDDSSIRLRGPGGNVVLGRQTRPGDNKIRWELWSSLSAKDGLQDGQYTVEIVGTDKAGNSTLPIQISFLFDNLAPELVSLKPVRDGEPFAILGNTVYHNLPLNQFIATFNDGEFGTGVVFSGEQEPTRIVFGTPNPDGSINAISGQSFPDKNNNELTYILDSPILKTDGSQDGNYILNIKATDSLGNTKSYTYQIVYDTQLPTLNTTVPAANQTVSSLSEVVVKLNEETSGIDFTQSNFRLIRSVEGNQIEVPINITNNGTDTATLTLLQSIALDGSDDGTYTIEVTPTDLAGNIGAVVRRQFYLVSQTQPQVRLTTPETETVSNLSNITVEIANYIGSGINFDASTITVRNTQGLIVPQAKVEVDAANNQLIWSTEASIPRNGTADGEYTITATFVDFSGNQFTGSFPLILDTQFPTIDTVEVGTDPQFQLSLDSAIDVIESFSQITVAFDETDVDFENTVVSLTGPDGAEIALHRSNDGAGLLTLNFQNLAKLGTYTLTVTPRDNIGNVSETPFIYRFHLDIAVPVVTTVLIGGQSGAVVYVNGSAGEIIATLTDTTGIGIAVGEDESNIVVTSDSGLPVPGVITIKDQNQLIWRPIALPTDGSADGRYTVAVTPVDKAGRIGDVAYRSFIYDTQTPRITAATRVTLNQPVSYIGGSLTRFTFSVEDVGPALLDLDAQTIVLKKKDGEAVQGHITHDGVNQIFFTLSTPLPTDGSADGEYVLTVELVDKAGNPYRVEHDIYYDSQVPQLSSVSLNTEIPLNLTPYQVTDVSETVNKLTLNFVEATRVDFENTVISLIGPDTTVISLTLEDNGVDQLTAGFVTLTQGGLYTLSVTPQDIAGNTARGAVPYPFRLEFEVPGLSSVKANTVATSVELIQHEIVEISAPIGSLVLDFTDALQGLSSVKANTADASVELAPYAITEID